MLVLGAHTPQLLPPPEYLTWISSHSIGELVSTRDWFFYWLILANLFLHSLGIIKVACNYPLRILHWVAFPSHQNSRVLLLPRPVHFHLNIRSTQYCYSSSLISGTGASTRLDHCDCLQSFSNEIWKIGCIFQFFGSSSLYATLLILLGI